MFNKILVAYDESPESGRALLTGIHLAKSLNAELKAVSVQENLPPYAGYIDAEVPGWDYSIASAGRQLLPGPAGPCTAGR
jgi:nucleotide-binding universal stress UspA family protein